MNYLSRSMSAFGSRTGDGIVNQEEIKFPEENDQNYDNTFALSNWDTWSDPIIPANKI